MNPHFIKVTFTRDARGMPVATGTLGNPEVDRLWNVRLPVWWERWLQNAGNAIFNS